MLNDVQISPQVGWALAGDRMAMMKYEKSEKQMEKMV